MGNVLSKSQIWKAVSLESLKHENNEWILSYFNETLKLFSMDQKLYINRIHYPENWNKTEGNLDWFGGFWMVSEFIIQFHIKGVPKKSAIAFWGSWYENLSYICLQIYFAGLIWDP